MSDQSPRERVARALFDEKHVPADQPWEEASQTSRDHYDFLAGIALAAIGLDDLGAAVERMGRAEYEDEPQRRHLGAGDYEAIPWEGIEEQYRELHRDTGRLLLSALFVTQEVEHA